MIAIKQSRVADSYSSGLRSRDRPISVVKLLALCLGTGALGAAGAWLFLVLVVSEKLEAPAALDGTVFFLLIDLGLIAVVLSVMVGAARWVFRGHGGIVGLTRRLAVALAVSTAIGFPLASLYGSLWAYSWDPAVVGVEVLIVMACLARGVVAASGWRRTQPDSRTT